jgi:hypothetical protein
MVVVQLEDTYWVGTGQQNSQDRGRLEVWSQGETDRIGIESREEDRPGAQIQ